MMKLIATTAVLAAASLPAVAFASVETEVLITNYQSGNHFWVGTLHATKNKCEDGRKVKLFSKVTGEDVKLGSTRSTQMGEDAVWSIEHLSSAGFYYAFAPKDDNCKADKSPVYKLTSS